MTIEAELSNGTVLEFPDGTDPKVIQNTVKKMVAQSAPSVSEATPNKKDKGFFETVDDVVRSVADGLTFGWANELSAAANSAIGDGDYRSNLAKEQKRTEGISPWVEIPGQIAGGLATGGYGAFKAMGSQAVKNAPRIARAAGYGGIGATEGAVAGAGFAKPGQRTEGAVEGAALVLGLGLAVPAVGTGFSLAKKAYLNLRGDAKEVAQRKLIQNLQRDGMSLDEAVARVDKMGGSGSFADLGGNVGGLAETVATKPGMGLSIAEETLEARHGGQVDRIADAFENATPQQRAAVLTDMSPRFRTTLKTQVPITDQFRELSSRPSIQAAWKAAQKLAREQGEDLPPLSGIVGDSRYLEVETTVLNWLKKGLDDVIEPKRDAVTGVVSSEHGKNLLEAMKKSRYDFRSMVRDLNPEYGKMLDEFGSVFKLDEAAEIGLRALNMKERDITKVVSRFSPEQKGAFQRSFVEDLNSRYAGVSEAGGDISARLVRMSPKIRAAFGDKAEDIIKTLKQEHTFSKTRNRVLGNSRTAYRGAAQADMADDGLGFAVDAATGTPSITMLKALKGYLQRPRDDVSDQLSPMLFQQGATSRDALLRELMEKQSKLSAGQSRASGMTGALLGSGAIPRITGAR